MSLFSRIGKKSRPSAATEEEVVLGIDVFPVTGLADAVMPLSRFCSVGKNDGAVDEDMILAARSVV